MISIIVWVIFERENPNVTGETSRNELISVIEFNLDFNHVLLHSFEQTMCYFNFILKSKLHSPPLKDA